MEMESGRWESGVMGKSDETLRLQILTLYLMRSRSCLCGFGGFPLFIYLFILWLLPCLHIFWHYQLIKQLLLAAKCLAQSSYYPIQTPPVFRVFSNPPVKCRPQWLHCMSKQRLLFGVIVIHCLKKSVCHSIMCAWQFHWGACVQNKPDEKSKGGAHSCRMCVCVCKFVYCK